MTDFFPRLCAALNLGTLQAAPRPLQGGYTHRMVALTTSHGRYAVKLLNPEIMQRPDAMDNFRRAEGFEALLEHAGLPILPALTIHGQKMHCLDGQYLYVFDYFDGHPLPEDAVTPFHCARMGETLARIHALSRCDAPAALPGGPEIDWPQLISGLSSHPENQPEAALMAGALPLLTRVTQAADRAARSLTPMLALCHNDMDGKNVLWQGDCFHVIDLECLDYADPRQEMLDLAISWGGYPLDEARFKAFVSAYAGAGGQLPDHADALFDSRRNHIDWLAYNARRACFDDAAERATGRSQIHETIHKLRFDQENRSRILQWLAKG